MTAPADARYAVDPTDVITWRDVMAFSAIAYGLSWAWWAPIVWPYLGQITWTGELPDGLGEIGAGRAALGMFGPAIAAFIMRAVRGAAIRGTLGIRRPWRYYAVAVAAPAFFVASVVAVDVGAGLGRFVAPDSPMFTAAAVLVVGGGVSLPLTIGEEYGWRGYLLPHLLPLGRVKATLVLAAMWGTWHVPILLIGLNYAGQPLWAVLPVFAATVALLAFPFTWLYVASGGSVLVVSVMHSVLNALGDTFTSVRYFPDSNPLILGGGGVVGTAMLLVFVGAWSAVRAVSRGQRATNYPVTTLRV